VQFQTDAEVLGNVIRTYLESGEVVVLLEASASV
jgi:hypothetical protein